MRLTDFPGTQITATYQATNAEIAPSLGRNLSNGVNGTVNIELIQPGTMYGPRQQSSISDCQSELVSAAARSDHLDLDNLVDSVGIATVNVTYGHCVQRSSSARYMKVGVQIDF